MTTSELTEAPKGPRDPAWTRDELILICEALRQNDWKLIRASDPRAETLSTTLRNLPIHPADVRTARFRSPSSVQRKAADLLTRRPSYQGIPTRGGHLDAQVLADFSREPDLMSSAANALSAMPEQELSGALAAAGREDFEDDALEGRLLFRRHRIYERSRSLRLKRLQAAQQTEEGLACQVCEFDFAQIYGSAGAGYIEVHHAVPLHASGYVRTRLSDLVLLCSNCHVIAHRVRPWPTVVELRDLIHR